MKGLGIIIISLALTLAFLVAGCAGDTAHDRLERIGRLADSDPKAAAVALDSVDAATLSEGDRNLHTLVGIKIADKNYQTHTSADEIERVIEYFGRHGEGSRYAEALYYGGRVNADLGDYPRALAYYQSALGELPENTADLNLRANVLSQLARSQMRVRSHNLATPCLEQSIAIDRQLGDTVNLVNDIQMLGANLLHLKKYGEARTTFAEGLRIAHILRDTNLMARNRMYLAAIHAEKEVYDSALLLIRGIPEKMSDTYRFAGMVYAAMIYRASGIPDTAFMYAYEVAHEQNTRNRRAALEILLSPELRDYVPTDSLYRHIGKYIEENEAYMEENGNSYAQLQNAVYNYSTHRERYNRAVRDKDISDLIALSLGILCLVLIILLLFILIRDRRRNMTASAHKDKHISEACGSPDETECENRNEEESLSLTRGLYLNSTQMRQREEMIRALLEKCGEMDGPPAPFPEITSSEPYMEIVRKLGKSITPKTYTTLTEELVDVVVRSSSDFEERLRILMGGRLKSGQLAFASLIRSGFTNTQIAEIISVQRNTVTARYKSIGETIFGRNCDTKLVRTAICIM